jgi:hypothetical protein
VFGFNVLVVRFVLHRKPAKSGAGGKGTWGKLGDEGDVEKKDVVDTPVEGETPAADASPAADGAAAAAAEPESTPEAPKDEDDKVRLRLRIILYDTWVSDWIGHYDGNSLSLPFCLCLFVCLLFVCVRARGSLIVVVEPRGV